MDVHKNVRLTPKGRKAMARSVVNDGLSNTPVARLHRSTPKTVAKCAGRYRELGVEALRRQRYTMDQIAAEAGLSRSTWAGSPSIFSGVA